MAAPADPELMLAAACCRWPRSPARVRAAHDAPVAIDWDRFGRVVKRQRIAGLIEPALRAVGIAAPAATMEQLTRQARRIVHQNLLATSETARLVRVIADAGYPVLAVKGVVLGARAYGSVALKHSKDIDLLILPEHVAPVIAVLERDGCRLTAPAATLSAAQRRVLPHYGKDVSLARDGQSLHVELHWRLFGNATLLPGVTARSPADFVEVGGGLRVPTLATPDLYAYLVLHGAVDGWSRMKWLADVNALVTPLDTAELLALHDHAGRLGAGLASAQALLLMVELFGLPLPEAFANTLRRSRRVRLLVAGAYRLMAVPDGSTEIADWWGGQMLSLAMQVLLGHGVRSHWQVLKSVLYMQTDMYRGSIPPALYPLYPVIRIPVWVARRIGGAGAHLAGRTATSGAKAR